MTYELFPDSGRTLAHEQWLITLASANLLPKKRVVDYRTAFFGYARSHMIVDENNQNMPPGREDIMW